MSKLVVQFLLGKGVDIGARNNVGITELKSVDSYLSISVCAVEHLLLEKRADVHNMVVQCYLWDHIHSY